MGSFDCLQPGLASLGMRRPGSSMNSRAVSTPHYLSTKAALRILSEGGNAVDAAIAAIVTQGVVAPETCGIGGDLFALVHAPGWDRPRALNASGYAGSGVNPDELRSRGLTSIPRGHPAAVTVPGCVDGLAVLATELGALPLAHSLEPAIAVAKEGFEVSLEQENAFTNEAGFYTANQAVAEFYPEGRPAKKGEQVTRPRLAMTLEALAARGRDGFYRGKPAADMVSELGGIITFEDLAGDQARWVEPIGCTIAGIKAWTVPPNSQGYLGLGTLALFEMLDPPDDHQNPTWWHLLIESYRALACERDELVADPRYLPISMERLLDPARLASIAGTVDSEKAGRWSRTIGAGSSTAYLCVADEAGMAVSMIQSNFFGTGSAFGARNSGFLLHNRGTGFSLVPGHPNEIRPGKQPMHTLSPTLWTESGTTRWLLGTRGGHYQPQLVAQVGARAILMETDLETAQCAPRWVVGNLGPRSHSRIAVEPGVDSRLVSDLRARGHEIDLANQPQPGWGPVSIIGIDRDTKRTARDPRVETSSAEDSRSTAVRSGTNESILR